MKTRKSANQGRQDDYNSSEDDKSSQDDDNAKDDTYFFEVKREFNIEWLGKFTYYDTKRAVHTFTFNDEFRQFLMDKKRLDEEKLKKSIEIKDKTLKTIWRDDTFLKASNLLHDLIFDFLPKGTGFVAISTPKTIVYDEMRDSFHIQGVNKIFPLKTTSFCEYDCDAFIFKSRFHSTIFTDLKATFYIGDIFVHNNKVHSTPRENIMAATSFTAANPKTSAQNSQQFATLAYFLKRDGTRNAKLVAVQEDMTNFRMEMLRYHPYMFSIAPQEKEKDKETNKNNETEKSKKHKNGLLRLYIRAQVEIVTFKEK